MKLTKMFNKVDDLLIRTKNMTGLHKLESIMKDAAANVFGSIGNRIGIPPEDLKFNPPNTFLSGENEIKRYNDRNPEAPLPSPFDKDSGPE